MRRHVDKPWGHEEIWAETPSYVGKILVVRAGHRLSLQYHRVKEETIYVESGLVRCLSGEDGQELEETILRPGDVLHIPPGLRHRFEALKDARLFEVSTPHLDDVVRLADDFGRRGTGKP
ncbi:MAG: cupin domain-containing protein [Acidobacteriota bacterium]